VARVVLVHGVGQQYLGRWSLQDGLARALADGVEHAGGRDLITPDEVTVAFYGNVFRSASGTRSIDLPLCVDDIDDKFERDFLFELWSAAATNEPDRVAAPDPAGTRAPTPVTVQHALNALLRSRCMPGAVAERFLLGTLRQVRRYFTEEPARRAAVASVCAAVGADTRVMVGHSLGSVVAYEALCAHPEWPVRALVTLGSPLGMPKLVFERLRPAPANGKGGWPAGLATWTNVCDRYDVVASRKTIGPLFNVPGGWRTVDDREVKNGWKVHDLGRHLTAAVTGSAVRAGLRH